MKLPEYGSNSVNYQDMSPSKYQEPSEPEPEKCNTCNGYHLGGCHRNPTPPAAEINSPVLKEREEFEKWVSDKHALLYGTEPPIRSKDGYVYGPTDIAWMGWQAARADRAELLDGIREAVRKEMLARFSNQLSMEEIASCAYAVEERARKLGGNDGDKSTTQRQT